MEFIGPYKQVGFGGIRYTLGGSILKSYLNSRAVVTVRLSQFEQGVGGIL